MRRRRDRKQETRDALLRSSSSIAKKSGFETTGVDGFMGAIGMAGARSTVTSNRRKRFSPFSWSAS
jgi:hypothetical protein